MNPSVTEQVVLLRAQVDYLPERLPEMPGLGLRPVAWTDLDQTQATEQWNLLTEFVEWPRDHYGRTESVPGCWYIHAAQREELSALRTAWAGAYLVEGCGRSRSRYSENAFVTDRPVRSSTPSE